MKTKRYNFKAEALTQEGQLEAVFSVFDVIDSDGDVVKSSAIKDGIEIPLVWAHNWAMPVGKGTIHNDGKKAIFKGQFFLDTTWGQDAYKTVKAMGDLQEYSWGFQVLKQEKGEQEGRAVNNITDTTPFEVSPVLVGANRETGTVGIKSDREGAKFSQKMYVDASVEGSHEELRDRLNTAFRDRQFTADSTAYGYSYVVATFDDRFIAMMWQWDDEEDSYWEVSYSVNEAGEILLGDPKQVKPETSFVPVNGQAMSYEQHSDYVQAAVSELLRRSKYLVDAVKRKEGRPISAARRQRMETVNTWLQDAAKEVQALLDETASVTASDDAEDNADKGRRLFGQFLRLQAQQVGVN